MLLILILGLATYRVARFIILDSLIDHPRLRLHQAILAKPTALRRKLHELITCPYCITFWIAGGFTWIADLYGDVPLPGVTWLTVATISFFPWKYIEG